MSGLKPIGLGMLALIFLAACTPTPLTAEPPRTQSVQPPLTATATPVPPSATPVIPATLTPQPPTATPSPTATATGTPATPSAGITPDPNLGLGSLLWEENFDGTSGWNWTFSDEAATFSLASGALNAVMKRSDLGWRIAGGPDVRAGDQQITLTVRANLCYANDEYGVLFRGQLDARGRFNGYVFKVNCAGQARLERLLENGQTVLLEWTPVSALQPGAPAENTLLVWAMQDQFNVYANDRFVGSATDKAFREGIFGLFLRDRTDGGLSVSYTRLRVRQVERSK